MTCVANCHRSSHWLSRSLSFPALQSARGSKLAGASPCRPASTRRELEIRCSCRSCTHRKQPAPVTGQAVVANTIEYPDQAGWFSLACLDFFPLDFGVAWQNRIRCTCAPAASSFSRSPWFEGSQTSTRQMLARKLACCLYAHAVFAVPDSAAELCRARPTMLSHAELVRSPAITSSLANCCCWHGYIAVKMGWIG